MSTGGQKAPAIYLVDDDTVVRDSIEFLLSTVSLRCQSFVDGVSFLAAVPTLPDGCLLLDLMMPQVDGFDVMRWLVAANRTMPIILMTAAANSLIMRLASDIGPHVLLEKPFEEETLFAALANGFEALDCKSVDVAASKARASVGLLGSQEVLILRGLMGGLNTSALATAFNMPDVDVRRSRIALKERIGARDLYHAVRIGRRAGLEPISL